MLTVTRFIKVVAYRKKLPPTNSHDPSLSWSCEVTWQIHSSLAKDS